MRRGDAPRDGRTRSGRTGADDDRPEIEYEPDAGTSIIRDDLLQFGARTWATEWDVDDDTSSD